MPSRASPIAEKDPARPSAEHSADLVRIYRDMLLIRRFEQKAGQMYATGVISGFCHLYIGQEAVVVGLEHARDPADQIITGYRDHGHMLACGMDPRRVMAELTGRRDGYARGLGGSMHMFAPEKNFFGGHGIVGAQVPIGSGIAFANAYLGRKAVCITSFGDGAANQGQVYESFNMAALWKLPILYVIENNRYAMGTSLERASAQTDLSRRGLSFGIPGAQVDGMDAEAVLAAACAALDWCRSGRGPYILEMQTYRYGGHSMSDPAKYRSRDEVREVREHHDPLAHMRETLAERGLAGPEAFDAFDAEMRARVEDAAAFALENPPPGPERLDAYVFAPLRP